VTKVAVLGLGAMGSRMAHNLLRAQHQVTVYNRSPHRVRQLVELGAVWAQTPKDAARLADVVISSLTDDEASRSVWTDPCDGALHGLHADSLAIESSTVSPSWMTELHTTLGQRSHEIVEAPVIGSHQQAEAGSLIYLVGGSEEAYARARTVLSANASTMHHVGPIGSAMTLKLAIHGLLASQVASLSEVLRLATCAGVSRELMAALLDSLPPSTAGLQGALGQVLPRGPSAALPLELIERDLNYLVQTAATLGARVPTVTAVQAVYAHARLHGQNILDASARYPEDAEGPRETV
jgi:3-hydroxyisobutyrate dehydrogenase